MATRAVAALGLALIGIVLASLSGSCDGGARQVGFYNGKCGILDVEAIVAGVWQPSSGRIPPSPRLSSACSFNIASSP